jgi:hypothetical protein
MIRAPSIDLRFLEAIHAWETEANFEPMAKLMRVGFPKTMDETELFIRTARRAYFKKRRGRKHDAALDLVEVFYEFLKEGGFRHEQAVELALSTLARDITKNEDDAKRLGIAMPDPEKVLNYLRRSKQPRH